MLTTPPPTLPDAIAAATKDDPRADYQTLSVQGMVFDQERRCWVAAANAIVHSALHCPALMVRPPHEPVPVALSATVAGEIFARLVRMNDGPVHLALKTAVQQALDSIPQATVYQASRDIAGWFALPQPLDGASLTRFNDGLPILVLAKLFGIAAPHWAELIDDVLAFVRCVAPGGSAEEISAGMAAAARLSSRMQCQLHAPGPLLQALYQAMAKQDLPDTARQWTVANAIGLWFQAAEGTTGLIGQGLLQGQAGGWQGSAAAWISHVLGDLPPIQNTRRFASCPISLAGYALQAGDPVLLLLAGPAADAAQNLAFGAGAHACPGATWARLIAMTGIEHLLAHGLSDQPLPRHTWRRSANVRLPEFTA